MTALEQHSEKSVPHGLCDGGFLGGRPSGTGSSAAEGGAGLECEMTWYAGCVREAHEEQAVPDGGAMIDDDECGVAHCTHEREAGSARPDASSVLNSRHCSLILLGSCPPVCLRCMGSARASRSGRSPKFE